MHRDSRCDLDAGAPVESLGPDAWIVVAEDRIVAKRGQHAGAATAADHLQRRKIEMIVVIVRDQHSVELGQIADGDARRIDSLRTREPERAGAL